MRPEHHAARVVDLRSDTVTRPTPAMRAAMATADVGDDFYGEDPTVTALEREAAAVLGVEAALLVVGGTMANLVALMCLARRGTAVVADANSDLARWETASTSAVAGVHVHPTALDPHSADPAALAATFAGMRTTGATCDAVVVENAHGSGGGSTWSLDLLAGVSAAARHARCAVVLDGARLFNAAVARGYAAADAARVADVVTISLYKGLGAPMGSLVCGSAAFVEDAARMRRTLGCTFRQAGVVAAAGLVALEGVERLRDDHALASALHAGLRDVLPPSWLPPRAPETNIVALPIGAAAARFVAAMRDRGVLVTEVVPGVVRLVTHHDVDEASIAAAVRAADAAAAAVTSATGGRQLTLELRPCPLALAAHAS